VCWLLLHGNIPGVLLHCTAWHVRDAFCVTTLNSSSFSHSAQFTAESLSSKDSIKCSCAGVFNHVAAAICPLAVLEIVDSVIVLKQPCCLMLQLVATAACGHAEADVVVLRHVVLLAAGCREACQWAGQHCMACC
jgi:hypothetical protein